MKNAYRLSYKFEKKFESFCFVLFSVSRGAGFFILLYYTYELSLSIVVTLKNINIVSEVPAECFRHLP